MTIKMQYHKVDTKEVNASLYAKDASEVLIRHIKDRGYSARPLEQDSYVVGVVSSLADFRIDTDPLDFTEGAYFEALGVEHKIRRGTVREIMGDVIAELMRDRAVWESEELKCVICDRTFDRAFAKENQDKDCDFEYCGCNQ